MHWLVYIREAVFGQHDHLHAAPFEKLDEAASDVIHRPQVRHNGRIQRGRTTRRRP